MKVKSCSPWMVPVRKCGLLLERGHLFIPGLQTTVVRQVPSAWGWVPGPRDGSGSEGSLRRGGSCPRQGRFQQVLTVAHSPAPHPCWCDALRKWR